MKLLLTGATGYLGSHLVQNCLQQGHELACVVRDPERLGRLETLKHRVNLIPVDQLWDKIKLFAPETVIHTACTYARGKHTLEDVLSGNLLFPLKVLQAACAAGAIRWINTGTCLPAYVDSYALSKDQFCQWGRFYADTSPIQFINLHLEHFYGPDAPEDQFLTWLVRKLKANEPIYLTAGTQKRDFIYIEDVLNIYMKLLNIPVQEDYLEIPVGTGVAPSIREVVEYLRYIIQSSSEVHFGAVPARKHEPDSQCDTTRLRQLGITSLRSWQDGLQYMVEGNRN